MRLPLLALITSSALAVALAAPAHVQSAPDYRPRPIAEVNVNALVSETQGLGDDDSKVEFAWWMPPQFWERALMDADMNKADQRQIVDLFRKYVVVAVVKGNVGDFGVSGFADEDTLRDQVRLVAADGSRIAPLQRKELETELAVLFTMMRPVMATFIGPMGQNMQLFAFPGTDAAGKPRADALASGTLRFELDRTPFTFETPLPSLLMPMYDGTTGKEFPGTFRFNPYTGAPLQATPAKKK